jgi:hypothetical protein
LTVKTPSGNKVLLALTMIDPSTGEDKTNITEFIADTLGSMESEASKVQFTRYDTWSGGTRWNLDAWAKAGRKYNNNIM